MPSAGVTRHPLHVEGTLEAAGRVRLTIGMKGSQARRSTGGACVWSPRAEPAVKPCRAHLGGLRREWPIHSGAAGRRASQASQGELSEP